MFRRFLRLFQILTRLEACSVIYALALGAVERGAHYITSYPGLPGYLLFAACLCAVFMGGGTILDAVRHFQVMEAAKDETVQPTGDRKRVGEGTGVSVLVELGRRCCIKTNKNQRVN